MLLNYRKIPQTRFPADKLTLQLTLETINRYASLGDKPIQKCLRTLIIPGLICAILPVDFMLGFMVDFVILLYFIVFYGQYGRFLR